MLLAAAAVTAMSLLLPAVAADAAHAQPVRPPPPAVGNYTAGDADGQFSSPEGVVMLFNGTIYVADTGNDRVQVFYPNGTFAFKFGSSGDGDGEFSSPTGLPWNPMDIEVGLAR